MTTVDEQIQSCRELLKMFQEERQTYTDKQDVDIQDVLASMKQKQKIVDAFAQQKELNKQTPKNDKERKRLRELAQLLEQLLVIEQENEILLTRLLKNEAPADNAKPAGKPKSRPALQQQLPFVPQNGANEQKKPFQPLKKNNNAFKPAPKYI